MKITKQWLRDRGACDSSFNHVCENNYIGLDGTVFVKKLIQNNRLSDANWLIVRIMNKKQLVNYAIFAAEQVLDIYEKKCPKDNKPRKAIKSAKEYLRNPCKKTEDAAAHAAAHAAKAAYSAAKAAYDDASYAAYFAAEAEADATIKRNKLLNILNNGLDLLKAYHYNTNNINIQP